MTNNILIAAALLISACSAGAAWQVLTESSVIESKVQLLSEEIAHLKGEINLLETTTAELRQIQEARRVAAEIAESRQNSPRGRSSNPAKSSDEEESLNISVKSLPSAEEIAEREELAALITDEDAAMDQPSGEGDLFKERIRAIQEELRAEESNARAERRRERAIVRVKEQVESNSEKLMLMPVQQEDLISSLTDTVLKFGEIQAKVREGEMEWAEAGPIFQEQRAASEEQLKKILSPDQYTIFQKIQEDQPGAFGIGGGGRRGMGAFRMPANTSGSSDSGTSTPQPQPGG